MLQFEIDKLRAGVQQLRGRVHDEDVRGEVKALEAHLNRLTEQHVKEVARTHELRKRIHSLEQQVAALSLALGEQGIIPTGDTQ